MAKKRIKYIKVKDLISMGYLLESSIRLLTVLYAEDNPLKVKMKAELERDFNEVVALKSEIQKQSEWAYGYICLDRFKLNDGTSGGTVKACTQNWRTALFQATENHTSYIVAVNETGYKAMEARLAEGEHLWLDSYTK